MEKLKCANLCNCMSKLLLIDFVREYREGFMLSNFASDVYEGQLCLVSDEIVDEGDYDYDGNYIRWGETYKDSSGSYRKFGDDFVDGEGNWVRL